MALSNMAREPRREITESVIGIVIVGALLWADYEFATWLEGCAGYDASGSANFPWPVGMVAGPFVALSAVVSVFLAHSLGEVVCDRLQNAGLHLRPRKREAGGT